MQNKSAASSLVAMDLGHAFAKLGRFRRTAAGWQLSDWQLLPASQSGWLDQRNGEERIHPWSELKQSAGRSLVSTTRLPALPILVAGFANDHIEDALQFCKQIGLDVTGVLSRKQLVWEDPDDQSQAFRAVIIAGGFERKKKKALEALIDELRPILRTAAGEEGQLPVFFLGCEELMSVVEDGFEGKHKIHLLPELWPDKDHKNFLRLFTELQSLSLYESVHSDATVGEVAKSLSIDSGYSGLLAALAQLTRHWKADTLLVDVGHAKTAVCWSHYRQDGQDYDFSEQTEPDGEIVMAAGEQTGGGFGVRILPHQGISGPLTQVLSDRGDDGLTGIWTESRYQRLRDRRLNHVLYPSIVPDADDLKWQSVLIRRLLTQVWQGLPPGFQPAHVVLSGACFGPGTRADQLIESVLVPSNPGQTAQFWVNRAPLLGLLGLLSKLGPEAGAFDPTQWLQPLLDYVVVGGKAARGGRLSKVEVLVEEEVAKEFNIRQGETHVLKLRPEQGMRVRLIPHSKAHVGWGKSGQAQEITPTAEASHGLILDGRGA